MSEYTDTDIVFQPLPNTNRFIDISGKKFNRLQVLGFAETNVRGALWWCRCECGTVVKIYGWVLRSGATRSCGCLQIEAASNKSHGMSHTRIHWVWVAMVRRCTDPKIANYHNYGGRGITVCERWLHFENFYADMGDSPGPDYSIERIDNDGGYSKENCCWATRKEQSRNRRTNLPITFNGKTQCLTDWAIEIGITPTALYSRIVRHKWPIEKALTTPLRD